MMFVENVIVPDEFCTIYFSCDLDACHGRCCVEGDAGAPLESKEINDLNEHLDTLLRYVDEDAFHVLVTQGTFDFNLEGKTCTPMKANGECAYMIWENGHASCVIEILYHRGLFPWKKPISCHLYPIRIKNIGVFEKMYLHRWSICQAAYLASKRPENLLLVFLREALIRKYGLSFYKRLIEQCKLDAV